MKRLPISLPFAIAVFLNCAEYNTDPLLLLNLAGGGSNPVRSIQSGVHSIATTSDTIAITSVTSGLAFVYCSMSVGSSNESYMPTCRLNGTSQLVIESNSGSAQSVAWYVVEFSSGASVQSGSTSMTTGVTQLDVAVSTFDTSRSFPIVMSRMSGAVQSVDERRTVTVQMLDSSTLRFQRNESDPALTTNIEWQLVYLPACSVQSGQSTIPAASSSLVVPISTVSTGQAFSVISSRAAAASNGIEAEYVVRAALSSSSITLSRESTLNTVDVSWSVVECFDGTTVQHGSTTVSAAYGNSPLLTGSLSSAIDQSRSIPIATNSIWDSTPDLTSAADQDSGFFRTNFQDSSTVQFLRGSNQTPKAGTINWQAIQFVN
ncbi:MAG: hypothetical protein KDK35_04135 [Leptospiraceae bacterium]|nr:hypothetical protein [Leptospiraceae bacterium]